MLSLHFIELKSSEENVKYNLDGSVKLTHTNKLAGISSEVFGFTSQEDIAAMVKVFDKHIEEAQDNNKRQIAARNKMLFLVGINIGIRASDLRQVKWSYFLEDNSDGTFTFKKGYTIMPKKTAHKRKFVNLYFNQAIQKGLRNVMVGIDNDDIVYVPFSRAIKENRAIDKNLVDILHNISI